MSADTTSEGLCPVGDGPAARPGRAALPADEPGRTRRVRRLAGLFADEPELILAYLRASEHESSAAAGLILDAAQLALAGRPLYADLLYCSGQAAVHAGQYEIAARLLEQALRVNPSYRDALILAARVALQCQDADRAETLLHTALANGADYPDVHMLLATVWRRQGDPTRARRAYERALELNSTLAAARTGLAALPEVPGGRSHELPA